MVFSVFLADAQPERLVGEVIRQPRGVPEQLARRAVWKSIQGGPAVKQPGGKLVSQRLIQTLWGSRTRLPALTWVLCGSLVVVDEAAEDGPALDAFQR